MVDRYDGVRAQRPIVHGKAAVMLLAAGGMPSPKPHRNLRVPLVLHVRRVPNGRNVLNAPSVLHTLHVPRGLRTPIGKTGMQIVHRLTEKSCAVSALFMMHSGLILLGKAQITMPGMVPVRIPGTNTQAYARSTASSCTSRATNSGSLRNRPVWTWEDQ